MSINTIANWRRNGYQRQRCDATQAATASRNPRGRLSKSGCGPPCGPHSLRTSPTTPGTATEEPSTVCPRRKLRLIPAAAFRSNSMRSGSDSSPKIKSHKLLVRADAPIFCTGESGGRSDAGGRGGAGADAGSPPVSWPSVPNRVFLCVAKVKCATETTARGRNQSSVLEHCPAQPRLRNGRTLCRCCTVTSGKTTTI